MQFLIAIEEMQTQQRAENGVTEIVIGIIGEPAFEEKDEQTDLTALGTAFLDAGPVTNTSIDDLPDDVRSILLAEQHRKVSGVILPSSFYSRDKVQKNDGK